MTNKKLKQSTGFTIIEVMIVLAIAGLIMLIVFLAVPALERSSRNTQRKNDASNILGGLNDYVNNNNGELPTSQDAFTAALFSASGNGCSNTTGNVHLGYYDCGNVSYLKNSTQGDITPPSPSVDNVYVYSGAACDNNTPTGTGASARSVAIVYWVETSGSKMEQCIQS